jgi:hypothetical protein
VAHTLTSSRPARIAWPARTRGGWRSWPLCCPRCCLTPYAEGVPSCRPTDRWSRPSRNEHWIRNGCRHHSTTPGGSTVQPDDESPRATAAIVTGVARRATSAVDGDRLSPFGRTGIRRWPARLPSIRFLRVITYPVAIVHGDTRPERRSADACPPIATMVPAGLRAYHWRPVTISRTSPTSSPGTLLDPDSAATRSGGQATMSPTDGRHVPAAGRMAMIGA